MRKKKQTHLIKDTTSMDVYSSTQFLLTLIQLSKLNAKSGALGKNTTTLHLYVSTHIV